MRHYRRLVVCISLAYAGTLSVGVAAARCPIPTSKQDRPVWANLNVPVEEGVLAGIGAASAQDALLETAVQKARTSALADLASQISVNVKAAVTVSETSKSGGGPVKSAVANVIAATTDVTLQNVVLAQWSDSVGCRVWVRAHLSREALDRVVKEQAARLMAKEIESLVGKASEGGAAIEAREDAAAAAAELVARTDFSAAPEISVDAFRLRITTAKRAIDEARNSRERALGLVREHSLAYAQFQAAVGPADRRKLAVRAAAPLQLLLAQPVDSRLLLPFSPAPRLATLLVESSAPCLARDVLARWPDSEREMSGDLLSRIHAAEIGRAHV